LSAQAHYKTPYWLKIHFAFLQTNEPPPGYYHFDGYFDGTLNFFDGFLPNFYHAELKTGGVWLRKMPIKSDKFRLFVGAGVSLNAEFNFSKQKERYVSYYAVPDQNWFLSPDFHLKAEYNFKKVQLKGEISLPIAAVGNYLDQFHYLPVNLDTCSIVKYKLTPNTFVFCNKIFQPTIALSAKFPLKETATKQWFFMIRYVFESLDINLKNFIEKKEQHDLKFGFVCEM